MKRRFAVVACGLTAALALAVGCKSSTNTDANSQYNANQPPPGGYAGGGGGYATGPTNTAPGPTYTAPPATTTAPAPTPTGQPTGQPAGALDPNAAMMAQAALGPLAAQHAPGAKPVGQPIGGMMMQQGQVAQIQVTIEPGKCYTGIGIALPGATAAQLELNPGQGLPITGLQTQEQTPQPVLGGKDKCFKNPLPVPMPVPATFRVKVLQGSGPVFAQLYAK